MASAVVGLLRVLLTANTAEFTTGLKAAANQMTAFSRDLNNMGRQMTSAGSALTKTFTLPLLALGAGSAKLAIDFESSFAGVRKTVDGVSDSSGHLTEAGKQLAQGFRDLAKTIPVNVNELNKIGEAAGALGIKKEDILEFSSVMAQLGVTTNLTSDQAATSIAQIQNIFNASGKDTKNFASALVALGNAGASTESQIVDFASRLAGAGHQIGLSQQSVLGFSAALANMGLNAELGGTALSKVMSKMSVAVDTGGAKLEAFAKTAGMTADAFKTLFKSDPTEAILRFTEGLGRAGVSGQNMTIILNDLGLKGSNVQDVMKRLAGGAGQMREAVELSTKAWKENTALTNEAGIRFQTTESQLKLLWNRLQDVGITIGLALTPVIKSLVGAFDTLIPALEGIAHGFASLPTAFQVIIVGLGAVVAAAGPVLFIFGQLASSAGAVAAAFATKGVATKLLAAAFGTVAPAAEGAAVGTGLFSAALAFLTNPITLIVGGLALLAFGIYKISTAETDLEKSLRESGIAFKDHTAEIESALRTYKELSIRHDLTTKETAELDKVTRLLAGASGLSVEAFNKEEGASGSLTAALHAQLLKRKELYEQAVNQGRTAAADAAGALARAQAELDKVLAGKATRTIHTVDDRGGQGIAVPLDANERVAEVNRLKGVIAELQVKADAAKASVQALTGGGLKTDINLSGPLKAGSQAAAALTDKLDALHDKIEEADASIAALSSTVRTKLIEAIKAHAGTDKELADAAGLTEFAFKRFEEQLKANTKEGKTHEKSLKAQAKAEDELASDMDSLTQGMVDQIETLLDQKKAEGDIVKVLKVTATQVNQVQAAQKARIKDEEDAADVRKDLAKRDIKLIGDHLDAFMEAKDKELEAEAIAQERLIELGMAGAALKVRQLEVQRAAEIKAHKESKAAIDAFYDYEIKVALKTADTIDERMRRAGVVTKATHVAQLREEEEFYAFMLAHSDQFTKADIKNQRARVAAAKAAAGEIAKAYGEAISQIGSLLAQIGSQIGGSSGATISAFGGITSSIGNATSATQKYMKAVQAGTATTADAIGQYGLMVSTVWGLGRALVAVTDFFDGAGQAEADMRAQGGNVLRDFQLAARLAGQNLNILSTPQNANQQKANLAIINRAIEDNKRMMEAYNLTWRDFGDIAGEFVTQAAKDLASDFKTLTGRGVDENKVLKGMSTSLSQLVIDAIDTGKKIPKGLQPILEKLIRMGGLTDEAARKMLGLAEDTMPSLADITEAAGRYGLKLDDLGPKVKQLSINEIAKQIVKDFGTLTAAGVPFENLIKDIPTQVTDASGKTSTVMVGFHATVQKLVTDALSMGLTIPAAMKPIIEKFILLGGDQGLVDQFGNKLTDTSGINFETPITEKIDDLIGKIGELIDAIKGVGDEFENTASRARGAAEVIGKAIPRGSGTPPPPPPPPGGEEPAPGGEPPTDAGDYAVPRHASGGIVQPYSGAAARILKFIPRGTDTVPIMATPGEGVLTTSAMQAIGSQAFNDLNAGQTPSWNQASAGNSTNTATTTVTFERGAFEGVVVDSAERVEQLTLSIAKVIRQGGKPLTVWQDLPLTRNG